MLPIKGKTTMFIDGFLPSEKCRNNENLTFLCFTLKHFKINCVKEQINIYLRFSI